MSKGAIEIPGWALRNPISAGTHLFWALVAIYVTALFWRLTRGDRLRRWSVMTFGVSMCLLFTASGVYHALRVNPPTLEFFRLLDHSMIYVLIAGSYTPVLAVLLQGWQRTGLLILVWSLAVIGIVCKWVLTAPPYEVTVGLYVGMGWLALIPIPQMIKAVGLRGVLWTLLGGILYTLGGVCDAVGWPTLVSWLIGPHEVLHLLDMLASLIHVYFIIQYVLPYQPQPFFRAVPNTSLQQAAA